MPFLYSSPHYSRDAVVRELLSYYEFLVRLYYPAALLKRPPPGGWSSITAESAVFKCPPKNDTVVDLLRHIPYMDRDDHQDHQIFDACVCVDYSCTNPQSDLYEQLVFYNGEDHDEDDECAYFMEPHMACLGHPLERDGWHMYCDTDTGELLLVDRMNSNWITEDNAVDFFAKLKSQFTNLERLPVPEFEDTYEIWSPNEKWRGRYADELKEIFRKHGWPTESYQKEQCMAELLVFMKRVDDLEELRKGENQLGRLRIDEPSGNEGATNDQEEVPQPH